MREALTYKTIMRNRFKTVRNTLTGLQILQNTFKNVHKDLSYQIITKTKTKEGGKSNVTTNRTEHIQNSAQGT